MHTLSHLAWIMVHNGVPYINPLNQTIPLCSLFCLCFYLKLLCHISGHFTSYPVEIMVIMCVLQFAMCVK